jgi:hypothetical protein
MALYGEDNRLEGLGLLAVLRAHFANKTERVTGANPVITTDHALIHEGVAYTVGGTLTVANAQTGAIKFSIPDAAVASKVFDFTAEDADMVVMAGAPGYAGNLITVAFIDPDESGDTELEVDVEENETTGGWDITVNLALESGEIVTTAAEAVTAINQAAFDYDTGQLVIASLYDADESDSAEPEGAGVLNAISKANLTGGTDRHYVHFKPAGVYASQPVTVTLREAATYTGGSEVTPRNRNRIDGTDGIPDMKFYALANATVTGDNALTLDTKYVPGGQGGATRIGGQVESAEEWVLGYGKSYVLAFANASGNESIVGYDVFFYDETGA